MLKKERQREILKMVERTGKVEVDKLAQTLAVSEMTVRRDLTELDELGFLERVHGGALIPNQGKETAELPVVERGKEKTEIKERLGKAAASMINDGEKIFLGSGSTTAAIASSLVHLHHLTVITNALNIANILTTAHDVQVVIVGGFLRRS